MLQGMVSDGGACLKPLRFASRWSVTVAAAFALTAPSLALAQSARRGEIPVVVELFTAQGCTSCPQANAMLGRLAEDDGTVALTFSVDYWDYLGWKDTFAEPAFTARQRAYVSRMKLKEIYTPEVVVGGRTETPAVDEDEVEALVEVEAKARRRGPPMRFRYAGHFVTVEDGAVPRGGAEVWLVRYDPMAREVKVRTGDNAGKTIEHFNVVRQLERLGPWRGRTRTYTIPAAARPHLKPVVIVQGADGGPILGALSD